MRKSDHSPKCGDLLGNVKILGMFLIYIVFAFCSISAQAQSIGPNPPPEAYAKVRKEFEAKFGFIKEKASITNYHETKVFLKDISAPIAIEIEFDLVLPGVAGTVTAPSFNQKFPKQTKYGSDTAIGLKMMNVIDSPWKTLAPNGTTHIKHSYSIGQNLLYYSISRDLVCFIKNFGPLYPSEESWAKGKNQDSKLALVTTFPIKPKYSPPLHYYKGIIPIAFDQTATGADGAALFELDLGGTLLKAAAEVTALKDIEFWHSMAAWQEPHTVLERAGYAECQADESLNDRMRGYGPPNCYCNLSDSH